MGFGGPKCETRIGICSAEMAGFLTAAFLAHPGRPNPASVIALPLIMNSLRSISYPSSDTLPSFPGTQRGTAVSLARDSHAAAPDTVHFQPVVEHREIRAEAGRDLS